MTARGRPLPLLAAGCALLLVLGACGGDDGEDTGDDASATDTTDAAIAGTEAPCDADVCLSGIQFVPDTVTVAAGDTVTWASIDSPDHTVTADDGSFDSGTLSNGDAFEHTFDTAGDVTYHCEIHSSMTGTITVT